DESLPLYEQARAMYRGPFLPQEDDELWAQSMRVRLDKRYQHVIDRLRTGYEQTGEWSKAVEVLEQAKQVVEVRNE
ncbi:MAG: bacterial transcriptional activator domain-containing protein, partial [Nitrospira sp.]|nr:bacterial transcriptional activator domain-containing protein [Nitrospira sp.]